MGGLVTSPTVTFFPLGVADHACAPFRDRQATEPAGSRPWLALLCAQQERLTAPNKVWQEPQGCSWLSQQRPLGCKIWNKLKIKLIHQIQ